MAIILYVFLAGVLIAWLAFFYFVNHWPLKVVEHNVFCPVHKTPAKVRSVRSKVSFGAYMPTNVSSCSLFPQGQVSCEKQCMK
jgi:hypothetical protein